MTEHKIQRKRENDHEIKDINASLELGVGGGELTPKCQSGIL